MTADPFETARLRAAVLDTWRASPARFREDANAEELLAVGYAGRVLAELAANGADAAAAGGVPGEIALDIVDGQLRVANTGAPLTAAGVAALAALRASAKRDEGAVGRFGVGFTAVRAICDEPVVVSSTGAVRFSVAETDRAVRELGDPELTAELDRRHGVLPALRLPWPVTGLTPLEGFATEVRLPLREGVSAPALTVDLAIDLLWALPGLVAVTVPGFRVERSEGSDPHRAVMTVQGADGSIATSTYLTVDASGAVPAALLAERPVEERSRDRWWISWIVELEQSAGGTGRGEEAADRGRGAHGPTFGELGTHQSRRHDDDGIGVDQFGADGTGRDEEPADRGPGPDGPAAGELDAHRSHRSAADGIGAAIAPKPLESTLVGAPTETAERIALPARLIGSFPVDEARGRIAEGPLTDFLVAAAARAYVDLVRAASGSVTLLPLPTFPLGPFDAALREAIGAELAAAEVLADAAGRPLRPDRTILIAGIAGPAAARIADLLPGLVPWPVSPDDITRLRSLGARIEPLATATAALAGIERPPTFWREIYDGLAELPTDELADLPVPRHGGGTIIGPREVLLPEADSPWAGRAALLVPGLRLAAAGADHPLLRRLGAVPADADRILADPAFTDQIQVRYRDWEEGAEGDWDGIADLESGRVLDDWPDGVAEGPNGASASEGPAATGFGAVGAPGSGTVLRGQHFADLVCELVALAGDAVPDGLGDVLLTDSEGEPCPARDLLLPDAPLAAVLADDVDLPTVAPSWVDRYGAGVLERLGVRSGFAVRRVALPPTADLPDIDEWWAEVGAAAAPDETIVVIADLDYVDPDRWAEALRLISADPAARECLHPTGYGPSYSAWWLSWYAEIDGRPPRRWRLAAAAGLAGLYDISPADLPDALLAEIGVLGSLADAARDPEELLHRWADPGRTLPEVRVPAITAAVIAALNGAAPEDLPDTVRALSGAAVDAEGATVLDHPAYAQVLEADALVAGGADPALTADLLDLPLASEQHEGVVINGEATTTLGEAAGRALDLLGRADLAGVTVTIDAGLAVRVDGGQARRVAWWEADGALYADGSPAGLGRAVAYAAGCWGDRHRLVAAVGGEPWAEDGAGGVHA